ncbi:MAG: FAD-binding oxidoreductase, partial [Actinomycetales bacterium]|nr:FAD-binding oxidoreductase [Actinomycetales bacterium]
MTGRGVAEQPSLWDSTLPRHDFSTTPLVGRYDVAIVGAGLVGLATAIELAERGASVVVLEARHVGAGASGRTTAKVTLLQGTRLSGLLDRHGDELAAQYLAGNRAGQEWVARRAAALGVEVQHRAAVTYASTREDLDAVVAERDAAARLGLAVRERSTGDEPFPLVGAVELDEQLQLDPRAFLEALAGHAVARGVTIRTGARVTDVHGDDDGVVTTAGTVHAAHVVLATSSPISDRGGFFARLEPQRSYLTSYTGEGPFPQGMYLSAGSPTRSLR